ncbi:MULTISPECIES: alanine racemase [Dictyoglomus]|jgi:alanine racemase|uniref:Alanine racemase n=1 Tax=Dictyoglomus turgidum (strain DSM 6724 / Z-1310) TaxID=515635 RepID=B8E135_DICTD|nr:MULTISPECIES: alanine racemase [Dictyoglomus]ACK42772.1 alanine racemase [Dictyoglomus turgidum DSM 6724]HBU30831.1 alanine racemase [Dictyoglomus sp.]
MKEILAWREINLSFLLDNLKVIKEKVGGKVDVIAVVKADAYGHGAKVISLFLQKYANINTFAVAHIDEGIFLRKIGVNKKILVLSPQLKSSIPYYFEYELTPVISDIEFLDELGKYSNNKDKKLKVHLIFDTGMGREGFLPSESEEILKLLRRYPNLILEGISSHLSNPENKKDPYNIFQKKLFYDIYNQFKDEDLVFHFSNTGGIFNFPEFHFNAVRPGISLYGYGDKLLKPVMEIKARITLVKELPEGWGVGYGHTFMTEKSTKIAIVPLGYADGYRRDLSNKGRVIVNGEYCKIIGRVSMDQFTIDITDKEVKRGDLVTVMGRENEKMVDAQELAILSNTIPYEILTGFGSAKRLKSIYKFQGKVLNDPITELNL